MSRPRILYVSPIVPFPANSGSKIRVNHLLQALCEVGDVDAVCYAYARDWQTFAETPVVWPEWWSKLRSIQFVPHPKWPDGDMGTYRRHIGTRFIARDALLYRNYPIEPLRRRMSNLLATADLVWVEHLYAALALDWVAAKTVADLHDIESVKMRRQADTDPSPFFRWALRREADRFQRAELKAARRFGRVAVCSHEEVDFYGKAADRVWLLPNGVDDALLRAPSIPVVPDRIVFVGTLNYQANQDALRFFCAEILPRVRAQEPKVSLSIVGLNPVQWIRDLDDGQSVFVHANVPEIAPYVQGATLSIVPLRVGGGTRLKILESLALGTPVVSTTIGAEGLDLVDGEHLLLADSAETFADAVVRGLRDAELRSQLAESGRRRVQQQYLWSSVRAGVVDLTSEWLAKRQRRAE
jgi:glycosyltransferase involved in cell wall biosynthesis